ncbi:dymeclin [Thraustotheca clavata]|uniref:Dymeclin n=1 Tax=Thraustotheca clavata TaxID=74557 RepID=A0A1V9ZVS8_9STRA|nr:dymeclin [Thraustotheca clavata]
MMEYFVATETEVFPLADRGILLLLCLIHTNSRSTTDNVFRHAFMELVDRDEQQTASVNTISFSQLVNVLGRSLDTEISSLLLYTFITLHEEFLNTLCNSLDHELFTLPLLRAIYECNDPTLLFFNLSTLHKIVERPEVASTLHTTIMDEHIPWYTERYMIDISMGSTIIVIVLRLISKNMSTYREAELQTLCLSIVFNLMQFASQLHQYATQTLILMLEHWVKKEAFIQTELDRLAEDDENEQIKLLGKQKMYIECIHLVLGLISVCLTPRLLPQNPQMMYSLLHASSLFSSLANHPDLALQMSDDHTRIQGMLAYFRAIIDQEEESNNDDVHVLSVERVFEYIQHGSQVLFPKKSNEDDYYPQYYYKYEEDSQLANAFFGQYIWQRIVECTSDFQWAYDKLRLPNDVKATSAAKERD